MISQREKGIYFWFSLAQIALAGLLFGAFYAINDQIRVTWLAAPGAYLQLLSVMVLALIGEAALRPDAMRASAGRAPRRLATVSYTHLTLPTKA